MILAEDLTLRALNLCPASVVGNTELPIVAQHARS